ncbi:alpha/beta fold hydrolase [Pigmentiphaga sp. D-2]|uniref:alpha/beta fold hydrolase n=1 Tax=Pigmentiphaga sp. D-2 TaxID=1002116 RepID=UPI0014052564|nr:alpha/beta hydrolase [Pigmentiphaga sp. D-2]
MLAPHLQARCPSGDVQLAYRLFGPGPRPAQATPVVFIHGLSYFSYDWVDFGARLCGSDRAGCAMDMRGFGDSSFSPQKDYSIPAMAQDVENLLDHLGWPRAVLVAHSMGGRSATCLAARRPERVAGLVLVDWSPENAPAGSRRVAMTVAGTPDSFPSVDAAMRHFGTDPDTPAASRLRPRFEAYLREVPGGYALKRDPHFRDQFRRQLETGEKPRHGVDLWRALGDVSVPTLVLRGTRSDLFAAETLPAVQACNPRIRTREIEGGHHIAGENPDGVLEAIQTFLSQESL